MIQKAADWIIENTTSKTKAEILDNYTFYSHVGNALSLWRKTRAPVFWKKWEAEHPFQPEGTDEVAATDKVDQNAALSTEAAEEVPTDTAAAEETTPVETEPEAAGKNAEKNTETSVEPAPLIVPPEL